MYTRCPKCKEVHPLTASVLSRSTGLVQCGRCNRIFNALSFLSDDWHASQTFKPEESASGELPILGGRTKRNVRTAATTVTTEKSPVASEIDSDSAETSENSENSESDDTEVTEPGTEDTVPATISATDQADEDANAEQDESEPGTGKSNGKLWGLAALVLVLLTIVNVGWTFRDYWKEQPVVHQWLLDNHWVEADKPQGMLKNPAEIQLVSRDMHTHPTRTGILVLSVTFVNLAQQTQAFPTLRITLLDGGNQPIAQRRLPPAEYLRAGANIEAGLAPDVFLPILLELGDPGEQAVGFEIEFL